MGKVINFNGKKQVNKSSEMKKVDTWKTLEPNCVWWNYKPFCDMNCTERSLYEFLERLSLDGKDNRIKAHNLKEFEVEKDYDRIAELFNVKKSYLKQVIRKMISENFLSIKKVNGKEVIYGLGKEFLIASMGEKFKQNI